MFSGLTRKILDFRGRQLAVKEIKRRSSYVEIVFRALEDEDATTNIRLSLEDAQKLGRDLLFHDVKRS